MGLYLSVVFTQCVGRVIEAIEELVADFLLAVQHLECRAQKGHVQVGKLFIGRVLLGFPAEYGVGGKQAEGNAVGCRSHVVFHDTLD